MTERHSWDAATNPFRRESGWRKASVNDVEWKTTSSLHLTCTCPWSITRSSTVLGRCVPCDVVCGPPSPAGGDILVQNPTGHTNCLDGMGLPFRQVQNAACLEHLDPACFL